MLHVSPPPGDFPSLKGEFCRGWEKGECAFGPQCTFAHGPRELCEWPFPATLKTEPCRAFLAQGYCLLGVRCQFIHNSQNSPYRFDPEPVEVSLVTHRLPVFASLSPLEDMTFPQGRCINSPEVDTRPQLAPETSAVLALKKQVQLTPAPYRFLLSGLPYKVNKKNKVGAALFERAEDGDRYAYQVLYKGKVHAGKCIVETDSLEAALDLLRLHGRKVGSRDIAISIIGAKPAFSTASENKPAATRPVPKPINS